MAAGDFKLFEEFANSIGREGHNFSLDVLKMAFITNGVTPNKADPSPRFGVGSGIDYDANEVSSAGGYPAGGFTLTSVTWTETLGIAILDAADFSLTQDALGFTNAYWGILYNDSSATKEAIGFLDLGGPLSEQNGPIAVNFNSVGIARMSIL